MNDRPIEFVVEYLATGASGRFTVIGRCGDEPIRVHDRFNAVYRYKARRYPEEMGDEPIREVEEAADLRVECIHAYELSLPVLGQGMTGSLVLVGDGLRRVIPGWILGKSATSPAAAVVLPAGVLPERGT